MPNEQSSYSEAVAYVLRALEQSSRPLSAKELRNAIPKSTLKSEKDLAKLLEQMTKTDQIRSGKSRSIVYWPPSLEVQASERILETLSEVPLTKTDLENKLISLLIGWPQAKRNEMLARLIKEKRVYKVKPLAGNGQLLSARAEPTIQAYIRHALQLAVARLKKRGLTAEDVLDAAREILRQSPPATPSSWRHADDLEGLILERMLQLSPSAATGAPVQLSQLRHALRPEIDDKGVFDKTIMRLAEQGRVAVHRQDYLGSLSQEELAALVADGRGNYFSGITLRA